MSFAYATKDQMKVWKSAAVPDKDYPERSTNRVMLTVKEEQVEKGAKVQVGYLVASDGYVFIKRNLELDEDDVFAPFTSAIPRQTVEKAEKAMKQGDRAYFDENKVTVKEAIKDDNGDIMDWKVIAVLPYVEQMELFSEFENVLEKAIQSKDVTKSVTLDAKLIKKIAEQLRAGDESVFVEVSFRGDQDAVVLKAFEDMEYMEITAAVMPIRSTK